jgi:hypothetical protein
MKVLVFGFFSLAVLLNSCSSPTAPAYDGPGIYGQVSLEDSTGTPIPPPYSGITVSFPSASIVVNADSLGKWNIPNPPQGNYNILFSKEGFGSTSFKENYVITNSPGSSTGSFNEPGIVVLTQAPDSIVRVENVLVFDSTSPWTPSGFMVSVTATSPRVFLFIDTIPNVPSTGVHLSHPIELLEHVANEWDNADPEEISYLGLRHGQTVYVTACAASAATKYIDVNNHQVLGNVGPSSNAVPIVIP